jgi:V8-like Glu-specific endopeptidase
LKATLKTPGAVAFSRGGSGVGRAVHLYRSAFRLVQLAAWSGMLAACVEPPQQTQAADGQASVVIVQRDGQPDFCSGTVLASTLVVTARHCVQDVGAERPVDPATISLGVGAAVDDPALSRVAVAEIRVPGPQRFETAADLQGSDIAVLVPAHPLPLPGLGLPGQPPLPVPGDSLTLTGFGEDRFGRVGRRHDSDVTVTERTQTGFAYSGGGCLGDSGGPLLDAEGRLVAIASLGSSRHCEPQLTRYAEPLAPFADFLSDQLLRSGSNN